MSASRQNFCLYFLRLFFFYFGNRCMDFRECVSSGESDICLKVQKAFGLVWYPSAITISWTLACVSQMQSVNSQASSVNLLQAIALFRRTHQILKYPVYIYQGRSVERNMNGKLEIMMFPIIFYRPTLVPVPQIKQFSLDSWCFLRILSFLFLSHKYRLSPPSPRHACRRSGERVTLMR